MPSTKYKYDPKTLSYTSSESTFLKKIKDKALLVIGIFLSGVICSLILFFYLPSLSQLVADQNIQLQIEKIEEIKQLSEQHKDALKKLSEADEVLYRAVYGINPIPQDIRNAGVGGAEKYRPFINDKNTDNLYALKDQLTAVSNQLEVQALSYKQLVDSIKVKKEILACIPAIQPILNRDLKRIASGFGNRIHPIYKVRKFHTGIDLTAPTGTPIHAPGAGIVTYVGYKSGYGKTIEITHHLKNGDHFQYVTRYAHLDKYDVKVKDRVFRGQVIGKVGNTGTSTAPHLHYEVIKNGVRIDPMLSFVVDLDPYEYDQMILASASRLRAMK